jgi:hypothetical protein
MSGVTATHENHYINLSTLMNPERCNLNPFDRDITEGISLFTAVKNRKDSFEDALKTWVTHDQIDEIIVLDWDSVESLLPVIKKYQNGKIFLATAKDQPKWILSFACNLAARLTTRTRILKIDADVKILPGFFEKHNLEPGKFYCGNWRIRRNDNEMHLNGIVFLQREDFFRVNGYNEFIKFYGWDDSDLYQRLESAGLKRIDLDLDTLYHMPHGNRTLFQDKPGYLKNIPDAEWATFATFVNRHLGNTYGKWSPARKMMEFRISPLNDHLITCLQANDDENPVTPSMILESETVAVRERLAQLGTEIPDDLLDGLSRHELIELYNLYFLGKTDQASQHLFEIIRKSDLRDRVSLSGETTENTSDPTGKPPVQAGDNGFKEICTSWPRKFGHAFTSAISWLLFRRSK